MNFHLAHIIPDPRQHGLNGYREVIDSVQWGLRELGHAAEYGLNTLSSAATNIVFGAQMLPNDVLNSLPAETIVYNFEQMSGIGVADVRPCVQTMASRFVIWDYSEANVEKWHELGAVNVVLVPVGYAPILNRLPDPVDQDIDVLLYGSPGQDRLYAFYHLAEAGLTTVLVCGLYGQARDDLIARSKLILNVNLYSHSKIFEIVRVSYLLANQKAVIAIVDDDTRIDDDIRAAIKTSSPQNLVSDCRQLVEDADSRRRLERDGCDIFSRRDIRIILENALKVTGR
ncbi:MAG: hypothetical protein FIB06_06305 [Betaproteobacteria bacterium]|nr:hypothetical protein [Betaproteobacteria bacterium]